MVEKKIAKKIIKPEVEEIKPVVAEVAHDVADDLADEEISKEIAQAIKDNTDKSDRYFEAIGRRKTAVARIRLFTKGDKEFLVNDESYQKYFDMAEDQENAGASMKKMKCLDKFRVTVVVKGGGNSAQAESIRH